MRLVRTVSWAWVLTLLQLGLPPCGAENDFRPVPKSTAYAHCPMPPRRLQTDSRSCSEKLFIVVPCFNQGRTVLQTLLSIQAQACDTHTLVIDDDPVGGHLCARQVRRAHSAQNFTDRVEVVKNPYNLGLAGVRNLGLHMAGQRRYKYISFLDSDDAYAFGYIYAAMSVVADFDVVTSDQMLIAVDATSPHAVIAAHKWNVEVPSLAGLRRDGMLPIPNVLSVPFLQRIGGFVEEMVIGSEDYATWIRAIEMGARVRRLDLVGSCYRVSPGSMMRNELYTTLAPHMLTSKGASIMPVKRVCHSLDQLRQHLTGNKVGVLLEGALVRQPVQCLGWSWLALWKARVGCTVDILSLLSSGLANCKLAVTRKLCTPAELGQALFLKSYLLSNMDNSSDDSSSFLESCTDVLPSFNTIGVEMDMRALPDAGAPALSYQQYSYLSAASDVPPRLEPCDTFLDGLRDKQIPRPLQSDAVIDDARMRKLSDSSSSTEPLSVIDPNCLSSRHCIRLHRLIPNIVHFVHGLGTPDPYFTFANHVAVLSAKHVHQPSVIMLHVMHQPVGDWWARTLPHVQLVFYNLTSVNSVCSRCLLHYAHRADVLRLRVLREYGGLYMDLDMVSVRPLTPEMRRASFLAGWQDSDGWSWRQNKEHYGLCNAMMAAVPGAPFVEYLLRSYASFRSYGHDLFWDEHSVRLPAEMVDRCPRWIAEGHVTALPSARVYFPLWSEVDLLYQRSSVSKLQGIGELRNAYPEMLFFHLWSSGKVRPDDFADVTKAIRHYNGSIFGAVLISIANASLSVPFTPRPKADRLTYPMECKCSWVSRHRCGKKSDDNTACWFKCCSASSRDGSFHRGTAQQVALNGVQLFEDDVAGRVPPVKDRRLNSKRHL